MNDLASGKGKFVEEEACTPEKIRSTPERLGLWKAPPEVAKARKGSQAEWGEEHPGSDGVDPPAPD